MSQAFSLNCIVTSLLSLIFGLLIFSRRAKAPLSSPVTLWVGVCVFVAVWSFGLGMMTSAANQGAADFWIKVHYVGATIIPTVFLHFIYSILGLKEKSEKVVLMCYIASAIFLVATFMGQLAQAVPKPPFSFYTSPGRLYDIYSLYFSIAVLYAHYLMFKELRSSKAQRHRQIQYLFLGSGIGFVGGSTAFLPVYDIPIFPFGMYLVAIYVFIVGYAILNFQLLDISIILRKTLVYSSVTTVLTLVYFAVITTFTRAFQGLSQYHAVFSSAVAAGLITIFFQPLRIKVQAFVDAKFFRQYVDREEKLYELSREVITHATPEAMGDALMQVINATLHPKSSALYLKSPSGVGFDRVSASSPSHLPQKLDDDHILAAYFKDNPQPFLQDLSNDVGRSYSTRAREDREEAS